MYSESKNDRNPFYIATVVDNDDPTKNYRVRVRIPKIHDKIEDSKLPWAARVDRAFRGIEGDDVENQSKGKTPPKFDHCVPEVGTKLLILAIQNDVNSLIYLGALYKKTKYTPDGDKYLNTYGITADEDQFIGIDITGDENQIIVHFIGDVDVDKVKKVTVNAEDDITVKTKKTATVECKTLVAKASEKATVTSPKIELEGDVHITGKLDVDGNITSKAEVGAKSNSVKLSTHTHTVEGVEGGNSNIPTTEGIG